MNNLELRITALENALHQLTSSGFKTGEAINIIQQEETTFKVGDQIRKAYDKINIAMSEAKKNGNIDAIPKLQALKSEVPKKYAISKETMLKLNDVLNLLVGENRSQS